VYEDRRAINGSLKIQRRSHRRVSRHTEIQIADKAYDLT
jgi:hypothetical protein